MSLEQHTPDTPYHQRQNLRDWLQLHRSLLHDLQWPLIIFLALVSVGLGTLGFYKYYRTYSVLDCFYAALQLISMDSGGVQPPVPWELQISRFLSPLVAASTFVLALVEIFRDQAQLFRLALTRDHVVICGLSQKGVALAREFRKKNIPTVAIELNEDNPRIDTCREWGAIVIEGDARDPMLLKKARIHAARILVVVCDDDGVNAKIAMQAKEVVKHNQRGVLTCILHIVDPQLCSLLREREIEHDKTPAFRLEFFNVFERGAQLMVNEYLPFTPESLPPGREPRILVIGLGRFGESLVLQAARNLREKHFNPQKRLHVSVIDRDVDWKIGSLNVRYPHLAAACDLHGLKMNVRSPEFLSGGFLFDESGACCIDRIFVTMDDDSLNLNTALSLVRRLRPDPLPIVIRMSDGAGLAALLDGEEDSQSVFRSLHAFDLLDRTCTAEILLGGMHELLARSLHEGYVRAQESAGETPQANPSLAPWEQLPEHLKEANRRQVDHIRAELKHIGYTISPLILWDTPLPVFSTGEVEQMARMEHGFWSENLRKDGWTYAARPGNPNGKTHPDLVAWDDLPEVEKEKDRAVIRNLPEFLNQAGFQIEKSGIHTGTR